MNSRILHYLPALGIALAALTSCGGSDSSGDNKGGKTAGKGVEVSITPNFAGFERTLSEGDKMYVVDSGDADGVSVLSYDAAARAFKGRLRYAAATDELSGVVRPAYASKVAVDTAKSRITIDYSGQAGTESDARTREAFYFTRASVSSLTSAASSVRLYALTAFLRVKKAEDLSVSSYSLYSPQNSLATKSALPVKASSLNVVSQAVMPLASPLQLGSAGLLGSDGRITCSPAASGDTYIAFFAQDMLGPVVESCTTSASGVRLITSDAVTGDASTDNATYGGSIVSFTGGKEYALSVSGAARVGTFLCDAQYKARAIVFSVSSGDDAYGDGATAIAVSDAGAGAAVAWSRAAVIQGSAARYVTTNVFSDMNGRALSSYLAGNADYPAVSAAAQSATQMRGCSEWYLPSAGEWKACIDALGGRTGINRLLRQAGVSTQLGEKYWTASLKSLTEPYAVTLSGSQLSAIPQPLGSLAPVRAAVKF